MRVRSLGKGSWETAVGCRKTLGGQGGSDGVVRRVVGRFTFVRRSSRGGGGEVRAAGSGIGVE